jgi:DNA-binding beta-propeller fold protein YncE
LAGLLPDHLLSGKKVDGMVFTVTNQILHPWGRQSLIAGRPIDIAIDRAGSKLAVLNSNRVDLFDTTAGQLLGSMTIYAASYSGLAFRPESNELWVSEYARGAGAPAGDTIAISTIDASWGSRDR